MIVRLTDMFGLRNIVGYVIDMIVDEVAIVFKGQSCASIYTSCSYSSQDIPYSL
jgi:hypothetical protein